MVSSKGNTKLEIFGFWFANSWENLKVGFWSSDNRIKCNMRSCIRQATFISWDRITAHTFAMHEVSQESDWESIGFRKFAVEASVYNNDFTINNVTIFYYDEPNIIDDLMNSDVPMNSTDK